MKHLIVSFFALALVACGGPTWRASLSGANEKPNAVTTNGTGNVTATLEGTKLSLSGTYTGLSGPPISAHLHGPADANTNAANICAINFTEGATAGSGTLAGECDSATITALTTANLNSNMYYVNVHTAANQGGEIRGQLNKQ